MREPTFDTLTQRLDRVERENRWWKVLGTATVAVLGLVLFLGATGSKVAEEILARRFVLMDKDGKARASLVVEDHGLPSLTFFDSEGQGRSTLALDAKGPTLVFMDADGRPRAGLAVGADGSPVLLLRGSDGTDRVMLGVIPEASLAPGFAGLLLFDKHGKIRGALDVLPDGSPRMYLSGEDEKPRVGLRVLPGGSAGLVFSDTNGKVIWKAP